MNRREFVTAGVGTGLVVVRPPVDAFGTDVPSPGHTLQDNVRSAFPRLSAERYINAAAGTPLGAFAESGLERYMDFVRLGPADGRGAYFGEVMSGVRGAFAELIGAHAEEIALVHCTKAGEQIVLDGLDPIGSSRNVVTNDLHFSGSLHNLVGLQRAGADVRIVKNTDWRIPLEDMTDAMDDRTCLVAITLLSNINGRVEPIRELAAAAHAHGAYVYADIIQAAGIVPLDVRDLGIDFAAANSYKWLYGVHGSAFLYVRRDLQGTVLPDTLFPGHVQFNYEPWVDTPSSAIGDFGYTPRADASRYEPGHLSYLGYSAAYEGMRFIKQIGVASALAHSVTLNRRILSGLDPERFRCITPDIEQSPIMTVVAQDAAAVEARLRASHVVVSLLGNGRIRISPAVYNNAEDADALIAILNG